jgi:hypothetical protein
LGVPARDLIFDLRPDLTRVQCKTAVLRGSVSGGPVLFGSAMRERFAKRYYCASEVDAIAAYNPHLDRCFFIPLAEIPGRSCLQLRLDPCRNGQRVGVNWADDFGLDARMKALLGP